MNPQENVVVKQSIIPEPVSGSSTQSVTQPQAWKTLKKFQGLPNFITTRGFTLIELLVVVLIIGILAAVAVPQYQKAVLKSRFATVKEMAQSLANAEELYYLANDKYTADFDALDISLPPTTDEETEETESYKQFDTWQCLLSNASAPHVNCAVRQNNETIISLQIYLSKNSDWFRNDRWCVAETTDLNALANQVCKIETGKAQPDTHRSGDTWKVWRY